MPQKSDGAQATGTAQEQAATWLLTDIRKHAGKSLQEVGDAMGVNKFRISQIERDYPNITTPVLLRYMEAVGAQVLYRIKDETVPARQVVQDPARAAARETKREASREALRNVRNVGSV